MPPRESTTKSKAPRNHWYVPRFSLRTLLILVVALSMFFGWLGSVMVRVRHQRAAVSQIEALGGQVRYDYEFVARSDGKTPQPPGPKIVRMALGDDAFASVVCVQFNYEDRLNDGDLAVLGELPDLERAFLDGEGITDRGVQRLTQNTKLRGLCLSGTHVTPNGLIRADLAKRLEELSLGGPHVTDGSLQGLNQFESLQSLQLFRSPVTSKGLDSVTRIPNLKTLDILACPSFGDDGLRQLSTLRRLENLGLHGTAVTDAGMPYLESFSRLAFLNLGGTKVSGEGMHEVGRLRQLRQLLLWGTNLNDVGVARLGDLKRLERLMLRGTKITDAATIHLSHLRELRDLDLCATGVTDDGLKNLYTLTKLEHLDLGPHITQPAAAELKKKLPNCRIESFSAAGGQTFVIP